MLTNRFTDRNSDINLDHLGVSIRVVSCNGDFVTLEVIAPPTVEVRLAEDVFPKECCDESQHVSRPNPLGRLE